MKVRMVEVNAKVVKMMSLVNSMEEERRIAGSLEDQRLALA